MPVLVYEGPSAFDPSSRVKALLYLGSGNAKTGDMAQLAIVPADSTPLDAIRSGADASVCGTCPHRATVPGTLKGRACYVPPYYLAILGRGAKVADRVLGLDSAALLVKGRMLRLGSWGDPGALPLRVVEALTRHVKGWTGYTHAWRGRPDLRAYCMASVDSEAEAIEARAAGWRYFRVKRDGAKDAAGEITCPSETRGVHCQDCGLCNGAEPEDKRKCITITVHGAGAGAFGRKE